MQHFGRVRGSILSGGITYFGFLSFFPILALAFAVVGWVTGVYADATDQMVKAIQSVLPMVVSTSETALATWLADPSARKVVHDAKGPVLAVAGIQIALVTRKLLPREVRPPLWRTLALLALFITARLLARPRTGRRRPLANAPDPARGAFRVPGAGG